MSKITLRFLLSPAQIEDYVHFFLTPWYSSTVLVEMVVVTLFCAESFC